MLCTSHLTWPLFLPLFLLISKVPTSHQSSVAQVLSSVSILLFSSSSSFVFSLLHRLCCMPSSPSSFLFFFFCPFFFISSIEDPMAVIFLFKRESPKMCAGWIFDFDGIYQNWPKCLKYIRIGWNFLRGGTRGYLIPVCKPVRHFPSIPTGTEWNS